MRRYAIRTITAPAEYLKDGRYGDWSDSPGDARVFNRVCDAKNCLSYDPDGCEIIGVVVVTQSEWDLLQAALPKEGQMLIATADFESLEDDAAMLNALEFAGVDNWDGYDYRWEMLKEYRPESYKRLRGED